MSRPQGHRKSQSTSALAVIASGGAGSRSALASSSRKQQVPIPPVPSIPSIPTSSRLGRIQESTAIPHSGPGPSSMSSHVPASPEKRKRRSIPPSSSSTGISQSRERHLASSTSPHMPSMPLPSSSTRQEEKSRNRKSMPPISAAPRQSHSITVLQQSRRPPPSPGKTRPGGSGDRSSAEGLDELLDDRRGSLGDLLRERNKRKESLDEVAQSSAGEDRLSEVRGWLREVMSLRSNTRKRVGALTLLEKAIVKSCSRVEDRYTLPELLQLDIHTTLLSLITRHASTLTTRAQSIGHSALGPGDETLTPLLPELTICITILQGLCLIDSRAKISAGEDWVLEMLIDLLLLLRTQPPLEGAREKAVAYEIVELLCAIMVDSPVNSRVFERLAGLEAVTRVLKGTGVAKDVRMKCIEFLYFYLLPEGSPASSQRSVSDPSARNNGSTRSSASSNDSMYPPSPLNGSASSNSSHGSAPSLSASTFLSPTPTQLVTPQIDSFPSNTPRSPTSPGAGWRDIDIPFVPQTPKKRIQPSLGYLTPSTRRVSAGNRSTPGLPTVPGSPVVDSITEEASSESTPQSSNRFARDPVGLGFGLSETPSAVYPSSPRKTPTSTSSGMSRSNTQPSLSINTTGTRSVSGRSVSKSPLHQESFPSTPEESQPPPKLPKIRHSRTQSHGLAALAAVTGTDSPSQSAPTQPSPRAPKIRHSRTQSHMSGLIPSEPVPPLPAGFGGRSSRLPSSHSAVSLSNLMPPSPQPRSHSMSPDANQPGSRQSSGSSADTIVTAIHCPPPTPSVREYNTPGSSSSRPSISVSNNMERTPSKPKRAFPAELTKGLPPSATSSPNLSALANDNGNGPLMPKRRVPSEKRYSMLPPTSTLREREREDKSGSRDAKGNVRSVEEKKELLGAWLGNVDALVQGVEKVSFWGSAGKR